MKAVALVSLLAVFGVLSVHAANDTWTVMASHIMTICMGLDFMSPQVGVVSGSENGIGPEIKRTTDGGQTWTDVYHETALMMYMCMAFTDAEKGVTAGLGMDRYAASSAYTVDAGQTWTLTDDRMLFATYQDCEPVPYTPGMIVMPGTWENLLDGGYGAGIAISMNSGRDFAHFDWGIDTEARYAACGNSQICYITGGTWPDTEPLNGDVYRHFTQHIDFVKTKEGGLTHRINHRRNSKSAMPRTDGFIGVIAKTMDGGNTWTLQVNDTGRLYYNGIWAADPLNVWAVAEGDEGAWIFHTNDGGNTWVQQLFVSGASMITVKFFDKYEGWVAGSSALTEAGGMVAGMWHTTDGGDTWELNTIKNYYVNDLDLLDRDHVYAAAFSLLGDSAILQYTPQQ